MIELLVTEAAEKEFIASLRWYAKRSKRVANAFDAEFTRALESIKSEPERYPLCDERHRFYLLKRYPFQIIYRKELRNRWLIIAPAHTSRSPGYWSTR